MKKVILSIAAVAILASPALAQEKAIVPSTLGDNWFLQLQGGASYTISEYHKDASFGDVVTPYAAVSLGKYFSPKTGARLQVGGWESKNYYKLNNTDGTYKSKYFQLYRCNQQSPIIQHFILSFSRMGYDLGQF
jgi:hypothetical protein